MVPGDGQARAGAAAGPRPARPRAAPAAPAAPENGPLAVEIPFITGY